MIFFIGGSNQFYFLIINQIFYLIFRFVELSHLSSFIIFSILVLFCTMGKEISNFSKIIDQNYPLQHQRNLFYHLQLLIYHLQVIWHEHLSRLDLIIKTLLPIKTRTFFKYKWHPLMCNTTKIKLQCSGHIYNHSFDAIEGCRNDL